LLVDVVAAHHPGGALGSVAVPPGGVAEPTARRGHHGHADLDGRVSGVPVELLRLVRRWWRVAHPSRAWGGSEYYSAGSTRFRTDVLRGRGRCHGVPAGRSIPRGACQTTRGRRATCVAEPRCPGRGRAAGWAGDAHPRRRAAGRRGVRGPARRED